MLSLSSSKCSMGSYRNNTRARRPQILLILLSIPCSNLCKSSVSVRRSSSCSGGPPSRLPQNSRTCNPDGDCLCKPISAGEPTYAERLRLYVRPVHAVSFSTPSRPQNTKSGHTHLGNHKTPEPRTTPTDDTTTPPPRSAPTYRFRYHALAPHPSHHWPPLSRASSLSPSAWRRPSLFP